jgi:hypothetical protein
MTDSRRALFSGGLLALALPFIVVVGASFRGAYRCPRGRECLGMVGAFLILGLPALFIAMTLVTVATIGIVSPRIRAKVVLLSVTVTVVISAALFSLVWFTPHPPA